MLWDLAIKHLWRRKLRSILTILGVATAIQLYLMISGVMTTYEQETQRQIGGFAGKVIVQNQLDEDRGNTDILTSGTSLTAETAESLLAQAGIDRNSSSAMVVVPIARSLMPYMPPAVLAVGIEPGHEKAFLGGFKMEEGTGSLKDPYEAILGKNAAAYYQPAGSIAPVAVGQTIEVQGATFRVVGILQEAPQLFGNSVVIPISTAQELFDRPGIVSSVILTADRMDGVGHLKEKISSGFPSLLVTTQDEMTKNAMTVLRTMDVFMMVITNSTVVVAIVIITIVVIVAVMEQRRDIGTLRAVGAKRWRIFGMVAGESMVLSLLGAVLALPIAVFLVRWGMSEYNSLPGVLMVWWQTIVIATIMGLLASILPAWLAMRVDPIEAMRYE